MDELTILLRIGLAALLGGVLGVEREWRGHHAGFRTHILVAVGSCLFTLVGVDGLRPDVNSPGAGDIFQVDPARLPSQIVVGVGFLGGGAILKVGGWVRGLTTAANLWLAAALGLACGAGYYFAAAVCAGVSLLALAGLRPIERRFFPKKKRPVPHPSPHAEPHAPRVRAGRPDEEHA